jgi:hypothetical protein
VTAKNPATDCFLFTDTITIKLEFVRYFTLELLGNMKSMKCTFVYYTVMYLLCTRVNKLYHL